MFQCPVLSECFKVECESNPDCFFENYIILLSDVYIYTYTNKTDYVLIIQQILLEVSYSLSYWYTY